MGIWTFYYLTVHHDGDVSIVSEAQPATSDPVDVLSARLAADARAFVTARVALAGVDSYARSLHRYPVDRDLILAKCLVVMADAAFERASGTTIKALEAKVVAQFPDLAR